ncbi:MAG: ATP-binding cassette domain-containing protein [Saccharofermentanales bacterium]
MSDKTGDIIKIENLTADYKGTAIFTNLTFNLPGNGCVCFFGPSGSGKTTLLQIIAGLKKPYSGTVSMNLTKIAYVFQENRLVPWLSALENVSIVSESKEIATRWLEIVGLGNDIGKYPRQLSGGMKQRVNIVRALAYDAPVILLDEPFKGLDDIIKAKIIDILNELKKDRLLILVTHDQDDVRLLADEIINIG